MVNWCKNNVKNYTNYQSRGDTTIQYVKRLIDAGRIVNGKLTDLGVQTKNGKVLKKLDESFQITADAVVQAGNVSEKNSPNVLEICRSWVYNINR